MIIRHAEKPTKDGLVHGVTDIGAHDRHALSVRGWQRAGALVRYFAPLTPRPVDSQIATPRSIFASAATPLSPSLRALHTVQPLAAALGVPVRTAAAEGSEEALAAVVCGAEGPALVAWHHKRIPALTRAIAGGEVDCPTVWPEERFDVVWVLDRPDRDSAWRFSQVTQRLLPHDFAEPILTVICEDFSRSRSGS